LVIGPGKLGMIVARAWKQLNTSASIHLKFRSEQAERSKAMTEEGFHIVPVGEQTDLLCDLIVFCAPPTGNDRYALDVEEGFRYLKEGGLYVFTSAGSVYKENDGHNVNEESELLRTERSGKLIDAETVVINKGGCVVRLGGLYSSNSGAHNFYSKGGEFNSKPDGKINLVHYEDAGEAVLSCLNSPAKVNGQVFLVSDGVPISRRDILAAVRGSKLYSDMPDVSFTGGEGVDGKLYDSTKIRTTLQWKPKHASFDQFMKDH